MNRFLHRAGQEIVRAAPQLYVDLDVESDGIPGYGSLLSVGAVTPWGDEFYREMSPTSDMWITSRRVFCEDHGLERHRLKEEGLKPTEVMRQLAEWTLVQQTRHRKTGSVLVAFNASFDFPWIDLEMTKAGLENPYGIAGYCIKSLANKISPGYDWDRTSKSNLPEVVLPEDEFTHNALDDAKWQQKLHFALVGYLQ